MKRFLFVAVLGLTYLFANGCVLVVPVSTDEEKSEPTHKSGKHSKKHKTRKTERKSAYVQAENDATDRLLDNDKRPYYVAQRAGQ